MVRTKSRPNRNFHIEIAEIKSLKQIPGRDPCPNTRAKAVQGTVVQAISVGSLTKGPKQYDISRTASLAPANNASGILGPSQ